MSKLSLHISNFRAIRQADIDLEGITVLSGLNATGKSTINHLMYYAGHYSNYYEELLTGEFNRKMDSISYFLSRQALNHYSLYDSLTFREFATEMNSGKPYQSAFHILDGLLNYFKGGAQVKNLDREELGRVLGRQIKSRGPFLKALEELRGKIEAIYHQYNKDLNERPSDKLREKLSELFNTSTVNLSSNFSVKEDDQVIIGGGRKSVGFFSDFGRVFYIDTPMVVNFPGNTISSSFSQNWAELVNLFYDSDYTTSEPSYEEALMSEKLRGVIHGDVVLPSQDQIGTNRTRRVLFKDEGGEEYTLKEAATGVKSFAILQTLLHKGLLDSRTLLILDEPEAHLHPQWIVEYARIILQLHKTLGVRFLIASHSTDFIQSLYQLSSDNSTLSMNDGVTFYLAEPSDDIPLRYSFRNLGNDISDIFYCFNRSYDIMDHYSEAEDEQ